MALRTGEGQDGVGSEVVPSNNHIGVFMNTKWQEIQVYARGQVFSETLVINV